MSTHALVKTFHGVLALRYVYSYSVVLWHVTHNFDFQYGDFSIKYLV